MARNFGNNYAEFRSVLAIRLVVDLFTIHIDGEEIWNFVVLVFR